MLLLHLEKAVKNVLGLPTKQALPKQLFLAVTVHTVLEVFTSVLDAGFHGIS